MYNYTVDILADFSLFFRLFCTIIQLIRQQKSFPKYTIIQLIYFESFLPKHGLWTIWWFSCILSHFFLILLLIFRKRQHSPDQHKSSLITVFSMPYSLQYNYGLGIMHFSPFYFDKAKATGNHTNGSHHYNNFSFSPYLLKTICPLFLVSGISITR